MEVKGWDSDDKRWGGHTVVEAACVDVKVYE